MKRFISCLLIIFALCGCNVAKKATCDCEKWKSVDFKIFYNQPLDSLLQSPVVANFQQRQYRGSDANPYRFGALFLFDSKCTCGHFDTECTYLRIGFDTIKYQSEYNRDWSWSFELLRKEKISDISLVCGNRILSNGKYYDAVFW